MEIKIPELLAPAGSMDALKAAVNAGADAVYLSGKQFGARYYAANFDDVQLKEAARYAHLRGVKVYVTVNTLIKDHELQFMAKYLLFLYEIGVDGILVQDMGVASLANKLVPDLNLHASTQMTIHNLEGVIWASEFGFKRVVLARELTLTEIEKMARSLKKYKIELEIFAHGAICYSYSGQCLLSSFIGGRSGNRGMCAQPCRKPYDLLLGEKDEYGKPINMRKVPLKEKYLLSTRDLAIYEYLDRISSIHSLKIEGRMRSPEYVAIVVSVYRRALDSIAKGQWKPDKADIRDLKLAFNRGFTGGYLLERRNEAVMGRDRPGNRGIYVGSLVEYKKKNKEAVIEIKGNIIPEKGDGIVFMPLNQSKNEYGMAIRESPHIYKNKVKFVVQRPLKFGTPVFITRRKALMDKAQKIISGASDILKNQIIIDLDILVGNDGSILLKSKFNGPYDTMQLQLQADFKMQRAISKPLTEKIIENQFRRTGGTPFNIRNINIEYPGNLFASLGELNKLRRELFEKIEETLVSAYHPGKDKIKTVHDRLNKLIPQLSTRAQNTKINKKLDLAVYTDDLETLNGAIEGGCNRVYFDPFIKRNPLECKSKNDIENKIEASLNLILEAKSLCKDKNVDLILKLPEITSNTFLNALNPLLTQAFKVGINEVMVDGVGAAMAILNLKPQIELYASAGLNIWNHWSIKELECIFKGFTISPELSRDEIRTLAFNVHEKKINAKLELLVQGNLKSIVSKDCIPCMDPVNEIIKDKNQNKIFLGIHDIKKRMFPLLSDNECRTHILNSVELCLIDYVPLISNMGVDTLIIDARGRTKKYAREMSSIYKDAIEIGTKRDQKLKSDLGALKNEAKKISLGGITTGNFIRGVTEE